MRELMTWPSYVDVSDDAAKQASGTEYDGLTVMPKSGLNTELPIISSFEVFNDWFLFI